MSLRSVRGGFVVRASDGAVVSHAALENMPFEESIEPWVRAFFPGAGFVCIPGTTTVAAADLDLLTPGVLVVQAPKGAGKSKAIRAAVHAQLGPRVSVLQITFRRSLAWSSSALMGPGGSLYSALPSGSISARQHPRLTIVVNSISRVRGSYDVVVIDEIVSVLDMLAGALMSDSARVHALSTLARLVGSARTVVVADAMLDATCVDFVLACRQMTHAEAMPARFWPDAVASLRFVDYTARLHGEYTYVPHAKLDTWTSALEAAVTAGQRVVVPCMTKAQADALAAKYRDRYRVQLYTGDTDPGVLQDHMTDIHAHWSAASVLIYSPVITAGCSFELAHFDAVFFYGCARLGSVRSAIQMIARVRDVSTKTIHVFLAKAEAYTPLPGDALTRRPVYDTIVTYQDGYMKLLALLEQHRHMETLCSASSFAYYFWSLVVHSGARIGFAGRANTLEGPDREEPGGEGPATEGPATEVPATEGPPSAEFWWLHDWEGDGDVPEYEFGVAMAVGGTALERANKFHPDHLLDLGDIPACARTECVPGRQGARAVTPPWMAAPELKHVARIWLCLLARRVATGVLGVPWTPVPSLKRVPHAVHTTVPTTVPTAVPTTVPPTVPTAVHATVPPTVHATVPTAAPGAFLYAPVCVFGRHPRAPAAAAAAFKEHAEQYMDPDRSWLDVVPQTWALACAEAALRGCSKAAAALQTPCISEALEVSSRVADALLRYAVRVLHIGVTVGHQGAVPYRFAAGAGVVDFLIQDARGEEHVLVCRADGAAAVCGQKDLQKLHVLAACSDGPVASVAVLYLRTNEFVRRQHGGACCTFLARSSPTFVRAWHPMQHVCYAMDGYAYYAPLGGGVVPLTPALLEALPPTARVVSWGPVPRTSQADADVAAYIRRRLQADDTVPLCVHQASVVAPAEPQDDCGHAGINQLVKLYLGLCKKPFFVYFWNGKPYGFRAPCLRGCQ